MSVTHLLDTNVCIQMLRGQATNILHCLYRHPPGSVAAATISLGELAFGAHLANRTKESARVARLMRDFVMLPFSDAAAWEVGDIRAHLHKKGTPIGSLDMQIAAVARAEDLVLVTHNQKDFQRIPGMRLEDWQAKKMRKPSGP